MSTTTGNTKGRERVAAAVVQRERANPGSTASTAVEKAVKDDTKTHLEQFLFSADNDERFRAALAGSGVDPVAFRRTVATIFSANPSIGPTLTGNWRWNEKDIQVWLRSVAVAALHTAAMRFHPSPQFGQVWFVRYGKKIQLLVGYQGYVLAAKRAGWTVAADFIWAGQGYKIDRWHPENSWIEELDREIEEGEEPRRVWFRAASLGFEPVILSRTYQHYLNQRRFSESWKNDEKKRIAAASNGERFEPSSPWNTHPHRMVLKTAIRAERTQIPMFDDTDAGVRLAYAFQHDGAIGGQGELPSGDPGDLWLPDSVDDAVDDGTTIEVVERTPLTRMTDEQLAVELRESTVGRTMGDAVVEQVTTLLTTAGLDPEAVIGGIMLGDELPSRDILIGLVTITRDASF